MSKAAPSVDPAQTPPSAAKKEKEAVLATVVGIEKDALYGARVRKSFGSRVFWGTIVGCYWITAGLFYKVSFDDGDVDILTADEALEDAKQVSAANNSVVALCRRSSHEEDALRRSKANAATDSTSSSPPTYYNEMRHHRLKRKREDPVDTSRENIRRVRLWGQRLYASIFTSENKETFVKELLKTDDGQMGEMEATGQVAVGDMILAVNGTRALGLSSGQVSDLIRHVSRPISIVFLRPRPSETAQRLAEEKQASQASAVSEPAPVTTQRPQPPPALHGSMQPTRPSPSPTPNQQSGTNHYRVQDRPQPPGPAVNGPSQQFHRQDNPFLTPPLASSLRPTRVTRLLLDSSPRDSRAESAENSPSSSSDVTAVPFGVRSTVDVDADAAAIAAFAEPDLEGTDDVAVSAGMSRTTSFLSPHEASFVSSLPSTLDPVAASSASTSRSSGTSEAEGRSVIVRIHRPRLFLTLGSQGSFVAVTSFIRSEDGQCGEIEASGKVFIGDVLVAINDTRIRPMATPGEVARVVNSMSRPLDLSFERASWDVLEGRE
ncbi:hypothetical protein BBJ28_00015779 [Nothophytophthora sp. Chile5]|nr:hypothetical protein BBJ28_00015779 [Nothophytophthora sp. Chile5]